MQLKFKKYIENINIIFNITDIIQKYQLPCDFKYSVVEPIA